MIQLFPTSLRTLSLFIVFIAIFLTAIALSQWLSTSLQAIQVIEQTGYLGLLLVGIVAGLNVIVPIPAATFSALYNAAGLTTTGIILALALGTLIADMIGFWFGTKIKPVLEEKYPKIVSYTHKLATDRKILLIPFVALYAALIPFPNEAILIPLALTGVRFRFLLLPLLIGNILHQAILIIGIEVVTRFIF
jgi:membrane protein YqaA with SNARE-associated domain